MGFKANAIWEESISGTCLFLLKPFTLKETKGFEHITDTHLWKAMPQFLCGYYSEWYENECLTQSRKIFLLLMPIKVHLN